MAQAEQPAEPTGVEDQRPPDMEQRATWLELFFDLVVVVAVAMIAERTHEHSSPAGVGQSVVMYAALWIVWTAFMLYANVEGERARRQAILVGMACIAVMAAAVPEVGHGRDTAFAVAYIAGRAAAGRMMAGSGKALLDWPLAQQGAGVLPFLIGIWVAAPARYVLWAAAVVVDLVFAILTSGNREAVLRGLEHDRRARERRREAAVRRRGRRPARRMPPVPAFQITRVNRPHLGERLGLFTIIVLGEAVTQIVTATTRIDWAWAVAASTAAGFLAVIGLWWLTFQYGFTGSPQEQVTRLRAGVALPVHLASTAGIVGLSVGLGAAVTDAGDGVPGALRWVGCAALALYVAASAVGGALSGAPAVWLAAWALPALVLPIVAAVLWGERWPGWLLAVVLAAVIGWMTCYGPVRRWWARYRGRNGVLVDQSEGPKGRRQRDRRTRPAGDAADPPR